MKTIIPWSLVGLLSVLLLIAAQDKPAAPARQQATRPATQHGGDTANLRDMGARLIEALEATPGCLGTRPAQLADGQSVIVGFFENKAAAMRWYNHPMHVALRGMMPPAAGVPAGREPMVDVPDGVPVMALASIGFNGPPAFEGSPIPFHSISIEMYVPVNGGLRITDGFAPEAFADLVEKHFEGK